MTNCRERIPARGIVACDGARSRVAEALGVPKASLAGYSAHRGIAVLPPGGLPLPPDTIRQIWGEGVRAGLYPLSPTEVYWFTCFNDDGGSRPRGAEAVKQEALGLVRGWGLGIREAIEATPADQITRTKASWAHSSCGTAPSPSEACLPACLPAQVADRWSMPGPVGQGPITLAGDALHPMTPNLGQGGCVALEASPAADGGPLTRGALLTDSRAPSPPKKTQMQDAVVLARMLRPLAQGRDWSAVSGADVAAVLRDFERERLSRSLKITVRSNLMGRALQARSRIAFSGKRDEGIPGRPPGLGCSDHPTASRASSCADGQPGRVLCPGLVRSVRLQPIAFPGSHGLRLRPALVYRPRG